MAVLTAMNKVHHCDVVSVLHQPQCQTLYRLITYVLVSERMRPSTGWCCLGVFFTVLLLTVTGVFLCTTSTSLICSAIEAQELASEMSDIDDLTDFITSVECSPLS